MVTIRGKPAVYFLGLPGAGKSTLIAAVHGATGGVALSGGALLRRAMGRAGAATVASVLAGRPVSDHVITGLFAEELDRVSGAACALLDGSPATPEQFASINGMLCGRGFGAAPPLIVFLDPPTEVCARRLTEPRFHCERCFTPVKLGQGCSQCGGSAVLRPEYSGEAAANRLAWHAGVTVPIIRSAPVGTVLRIPAVPAVEESARKVVAWIGGRTGS